MDNLQQGINAYKSGNKEEARKYFILAMRENPNRENVWGWLYQVAKNDNERIQALNKVLAINPSNAEAREALNRLQAPKFDAPLPVPINPAPPKQNNNLLIGIGAAIVIFTCCMCVAISLNGSNIASPPLFTSGHQIKYVLSGSAQSAFVTYFNETGGTEQINANLPWSKEINVELGAPLSLVAQNNGTGSITCEIWVNGEKTKTSTSTAQYGVVTCSDWVY